MSSARKVAHIYMLNQGSSLPPNIPYPLCHSASAITHLTLVHCLLLGAGCVVAPLTPDCVPILSRGPPLWTAIITLCLCLAELLMELPVLFLHSVYSQGQCLPLHDPAWLLTQAGWQQEGAAICGEDTGHAMGTVRQSSAKRNQVWTVGQSPN